MGLCKSAGCTASLQYAHALWQLSAQCRSRGDYTRALRLADEAVDVSAALDEHDVAVQTLLADSSRRLFSQTVTVHAATRLTVSGGAENRCWPTRQLFVASSCWATLLAS